MTKIPVFRVFFRIVKTAFFALVFSFTTINAFANCWNITPGYACVQNSGVICPSGCYCPGGEDVSSNQGIGSLTGSCSAATPGSSIQGGAVRCPSER